MTSGAKSYFGRPCMKHPELAGLRRKASATCVQCCRDTSAEKRDARRRAEGKTKRVFYTPDEAAARIRQRDRIRSAERRKAHGYNAAQIERKRKWRATHRDRHLATNRAYDSKQRRENIQRKLSKNLRHRIYKAMVGKTRSVSAVGDLGIGIAEFRLYIERQFELGMTWNNYGLWHLDHRQPLAAFDLTDQEQVRTACHYTNYQPLWAIDNQRKHARTWDLVEGE